MYMAVLWMYRALLWAFLRRTTKMVRPSRITILYMYIYKYTCICIWLFCGCIGLFCGHVAAENNNHGAAFACCGTHNGHMYVSYAKQTHTYVCFIYMCLLHLYVWNVSVLRKRHTYVLRVAARTMDICMSVTQNRDIHMSVFICLRHMYVFYAKQTHVRHIYVTDIYMSRHIYVTDIYMQQTYICNIHIYV